jgi:hypothetical protein
MPATKNKSSNDGRRDAPPITLGEKSNMSKLITAIVVALIIAIASVHAKSETAKSACELAKVLSGETHIEIIIHPDIKGHWETALIRNRSRNTTESFDAIRGEITPERWGLSVYDAATTLLADIQRDMEIVPHEEGCASFVFTMERMKNNLHIIKQNGNLIGTMVGPMPKNDGLVK